MTYQSIKKEDVMLHIFDMFIYTIGWENWEIGNGYMNVLVFIIKIETIPLIGEIV